MLRAMLEARNQQVKSAKMNHHCECIFIIFSEEDYQLQLQQEEFECEIRKLAIGVLQKRKMAVQAVLEAKLQQVWFMILSLWGKRCQPIIEFWLLIPSLPKAIE